MPKAAKKVQPKKLEAPIQHYEQMLNAKERTYVEERLRGKTDKEANLAAGYAKSNQQHRWEVKEVLRRRTMEFGGRDRITTDRILGELSHMAFANLEDFLDANGDPLPFDQIPPEVRSAIRNYEVSDEKVKISLWDKSDALKTLTKLLGMEAPMRHEHTGKDGKPIEINVEERKKKIIDQIKAVVEMRQNKDGVYEPE